MTRRLPDDFLPAKCRPAPLTPPDCDLRNFPYMPLDVLRLRDSALAAGDSVAFHAAVILMCASWHQVPAASLPDDDVMLARLAGFGRDVRNWKRARAKGALHGFVLCSDDRHYHPVVAEKALAAAHSKTAQRGRTDAARLARASERARGSAGTSTMGAHDLDPVPLAHAPSLDAASISTAPAVHTRPQDSQRIDIPRNQSSVTDAPTQSKIDEKRREDKRKESNPPSLRDGPPRGGTAQPAKSTLDEHPPDPKVGKPVAVVPRGPVDDLRSLRGTRLPDDWQSSPELCAFAAELDLVPSKVTAEFRDYWHGRAGAGGRKADWSATFRNWCRRAAESPPRHRRVSKDMQARADDRSDWWRKEMAAAGYGSPSTEPSAADSDDGKIIDITN